MDTSIRDVASLEAMFQPGSSLAAVLDCMFDGIYVVDRSRRIIFWNRGAEDTTGYKRDEVIGRCCAESILCHIDQEGTLLCQGDCPLQKAMRTGTDYEAKVYPYHKSRRRFPVVTHVSPIRDPSGEVIGAVEVFRDVSKDDEFRVLQEKFNDLIRRYVSTMTFSDMMDLARGAHSDLSRNQDLTIMFVDVVAFTAFAENHAPYETTALLNELFTMAETIIDACNGDIDKFIGDAVMAAFVDANDAVEAGRRLLGGIEELNASRAQRGRDPVRIRIGVHSGIVVQGDVGGVRRKDRTIIGDAVNTAARIEKLCTPNSLLISEATYARLKDSATLVFSQKTPIRGKDEMLALFTLKTETVQ